MSKIVGIDLGTTNSVVAVVEAGIPGVLADMDGNRLMPSVVYYPENGKLIVGGKAKRGQVANASRTIISIKRFIGRRFGDLNDKELRQPFDIIDIDGAIAVKIGENAFLGSQDSWAPKHPQNTRLEHRFLFFICLSRIPEPSRKPGV